MKRKFSSHIGVLTVIVVSMLGTAIAHAATTKPAKPDLGGSLSTTVECKPGWSLMLVPGAGRPRCVKD